MDNFISVIKSNLFKQFRQGIDIMSLNVSSYFILLIAEIFIKLMLLIDISNARRSYKAIWWKMALIRNISDLNI